MKINNELDHIYHSSRLSLFWVLVYSTIIILIFSGAGMAATKIRTHTLPTGKITLTIPYSKYVVGESISFTIKNEYNSSVYVFNNCPAEPLAVYRQVDGLWVRQHEQASISECSGEDRQVSVAAGAIVDSNFDLWQNLFIQPGKYRIVAFVEYYNALPYQEFEVVAASTATIQQQVVVPIVNTPAKTTQTPTIQVQEQEQEKQEQAPSRQSQTITTAGGSISVEYDSNYIYVLNINPNSGCHYEGGNSGAKVRVKFQCAKTEIDVRLSLNNGQLIQNIQTESEGEDD